MLLAPQGQLLGLLENRPTPEEAVALSERLANARAAVESERTVTAGSTVHDFELWPSVTLVQDDFESDDGGLTPSAGWVPGIWISLGTTVAACALVPSSNTPAHSSPA